MCGATRHYYILWCVRACGAEKNKFSGYGNIPYFPATKDMRLNLKIRCSVVLQFCSYYYAHVLKCEGVLISEFKHVSLNARKYGKEKLPTSRWSATFWSDMEDCMRVLIRMCVNQ